VMSLSGSLLILTGEKPLNEVAQHLPELLQKSALPEHLMKVAGVPKPYEAPISLAVDKLLEVGQLSEYSISGVVEALSLPELTGSLVKALGGDSASASEAVSALKTVVEGEVSFDSITALSAAVLEALVKVPNMPSEVSKVITTLLEKVDDLSAPLKILIDEPSSEAGIAFAQALSNSHLISDLSSDLGVSEAVQGYILQAESGLGDVSHLLETIK